tara:strand:- start:1487 stop:1678 length:192 start_codon:yes stop_codon:yes gene_type:complete
MSDKDFKNKQQDLTELNSDGNRSRGRYGEDLNKDTDLTLTKDEEELLKKKLEKMRKRDPFIYR